MNRIRIIGLALVAAFALSAAASASAAPPAFLHCAKNAAGKYSSKANCEAKKVGGTGWELEEVAAGSKIAFTDTSGVGKLEVPAAGTVVECKKDKSTGNITGPKTVGEVVVTFEGCEGTNGTKKCEVHSKGLKGNITTNKLEGELGKVAEAESATKVGLDLFPPGKKGAFVTLEGACLPIPTAPVEGSVIGEVTPVKTLAKTGKLIYTTNAAKEQKIQKFEAGVKDTLETFKLPATETTEDTITYKEGIEVSS